MLVFDVESSAPDGAKSEDWHSNMYEEHATIARQAQEKGGHGGGRDFCLFYIPSISLR
jgi:hypothetical protein